MKISKKAVTKVPLSTNGELILYFIGCGSAFAKTLKQNNLLVAKGQENVLIDCGGTCSQSLFEAGVSLRDIDTYLITHSHADHVGGLEEVHMMGRYVLNKKPKMIINETYEKILWEQSLRGGTEQSEKNPLKFEDLWDVIRPKRLDGMPRETEEVNMGTLNIKMPRTLHFPDSVTSWKDCAWSCGIILDDKIFFTSDTRFDRDLIEDYDDLFDFEMIFHDCQLFTGGVHASLDELCTLPRQLREKIVLMHYGDEWKQYLKKAEDAGFHSWAQEGHTYTF
ncbi:MAG: MBL fold metallo-hydrolase [Gammaproteobacteria bacterium]|nr:MBL fold metallo-hydrolase [Gammaproteobacteria bacterium]|tara:strand:- start:229 stop:1065 length:837 start_codon:yes stop_codon:yes gene_type:complete